MKRIALIFICLLAVLGTTECRNSGKKGTVNNNETECVEADEADDAQCEEDDGICPADEAEDMTEIADYAWEGTIGDEQISVWACCRLSDNLCVGEFNRDCLVVGRMFESGYIQLSVYDGTLLKGLISGNLTPDGDIEGEWTDFRGDDRTASLKAVDVPEYSYYPFKHPKYKDFRAASEYVVIQWDDTFNVLDLITDEAPMMAFRLSIPFSTSEVVSTIADDYSSWEGSPYENGKLVYSYSKNENLVFEFFEKFVEVSTEWVGEGDGYRQAEAVGSGTYILDSHFDDLPAFWFETDEEGEE